MSSAEESEPEDVIAVSQLESAKSDSPLKSIAQDRKKKPEEGSLLYSFPRSTGFNVPCPYKQYRNAGKYVG